MKKLTLLKLICILVIVLPTAAHSQVIAKKGTTVGLQTALRSALQDQQGATGLKQENVNHGGATFKVYKGMKGNTVVGEVVVVNEQGKEGPIQMVVALKSNCQIFDLGFTVFGEDHGKAALQWNYLRQYVGKSRTAGALEVDGISGATWTSTSVRTAVNKALNACTL